MVSFIRPLFAAAIVACIAAGVTPARAASAHREFDGNIVSMNRGQIKVHGVEGGKAQTIAFDGNFAKRGDLHVGEYVKVIFDQKLLGLRHADSVAPYGGMKMIKH